ncbi:cobyrinate a,c-diamide synthase [Streptomyces platensis]|uniref:Hydrogenobyrinate a,c-diamide synthase n=1 Tax=Streptomyces platensis TaxID=58346 RepID=A0AAE6NFQ3_STRPT|nr:cobyrinate a,c-diamide synthase [Streptomyces platensis]OSY36506.1 Cobyrinic acid A,C-diamide synthase [Streptomyces platensis]QEV51832.1 cobyrinate a,c-diamide synthase [Streptomyces platensis]
MSSGSIPRLVIAAPSSGAGKTTVATGLMAAFAEAGLTVSPHKVGPDYIDPGYHSLATGRPGRNLDAYLCGPDRIAPLFLHGAAGADLALVEGVMGLFDGASGMGELSSTAHVAKLLRAPVVLVVDASSQSRSVAALVHGFASWDPEVRLAGVILNKVGSDRHEELLREAMDSSGVPVLGALRRDGRAGTPSRHLGLVPVAERRSEAVESVAGLAARIRAGCDLEALLALARTVPELPDAAWDPAAHLAPAEGAAAAPEKPLIAVAGGAAFTFSYAEHAELLAAAGAEVAPFDPLRDEQLPPGTQGLVIGGGFPEMYAPDLSANAPLRAAVAELAASGAPVSAECAGLLYLSRSLDGKPMCGVLPAEARMTERLTLGYREAVALSDNALAAAGTRVRGHEFHRTALEPGAGADPAWGLTHPERRVEGFVAGGVHASYLHVHWAAEPSLAGRLVASAARSAAARGGGR